MLNNPMGPGRMPCRRYRPLPKSEMRPCLALRRRFDFLRPGRRVD
jgi:hypothetical protein